MSFSKDEERVYEAHIVIQLGSGRAYYCQRLRRLYFFDAPDKEIGATVQAVLHGLGYKSDIQPVRLDQHRYMTVGKKVQLEDSLLEPVFAALALSGVMVERDKCNYPKVNT